MELMQARLDESFSNQQRRRDMLTIAPGHSVDSDAWITTQLARAYASATAEEQAQMRSVIQPQLDRVKNSILTTRRQLLRYFAWLPQAAPEVYSAANELIGSDATAAERLLQPVLLGENEGVRASAADLLQRFPMQDWYTMGPYGISASGLPRELTDSGNDSQSEMRTALSNAHRDISIEELKLKPVWHNGLVEYRKGDPGDPVLDIETMRNTVGPPLIGPQYRYGRPHFTVRMLGNSIVIMNNLGQRIAAMNIRRATSDGGDSFARCQVNGGLILIETASELLAIDYYRKNDAADTVLWRHSLASPSASPFREAAQVTTATEQTPLGFTVQKRTGSARTSFVGPLTPVGVVVQTGATLSMLDAISGSVVWTREGFSEQTRFASSGLELAIVDPSTASVQIVDCRTVRNFAVENSRATGSTGMHMVLS